MPEIWMDVDAGLSEVPVNLLPLIDDTDFKTRETAIAYNAAGMDLVWNFVTAAGAFTQTAVTPTTSGSYDWTHQGDGMYTIEIPASGGASINNDTEGFGWFTGIATGVLPWRGPVIGFRAAGLNDALIESAYSTTRGLAGTALPNAAAEAAGGLYTRGTGAGQINQANNGQIDVNAARTGGTTNTGRDIGASVLLSSGTGTGQISLSSGAVLLQATQTGVTIPTVTTLTNAPADSSGVTTLLSRIPSGLFSGITSLAQWLGLIAGKQTGNSTARTELRATGAGSGTFDETTDSQEAIRDNMGTAQTGDAFARLGAPAGASVSADVAAVKAQTAAIETDTQDIQGRLPAALVSGRMASDAVAISGSTTAADNVEANIGNLDATVSSRLATSGYATPPTAGAIADQVWEETLADHSGTAGSTAAALNAAGSAGDPWNTALPGAYGNGTAGNILGNRLDAAVSTRATPAQVNAEADTALADAGVTTTVTGRIDAAISTRLAGASYTAPPSASTNASAVRTELTTELGRIDVATSTRLASTDYAAPPSAATTAGAVRTELATELGRLDVATSTLLASSSYTAPPSASTNASAVRTELATELARVDAAVSTRATPAQVATELATYDAPTKAELDAAVAAIIAAIGDAAMDEAIEGSITARQALRVILAAHAGKLSGASTTTVTVRDANDTKARITAQVDDDGNRTEVTLDVS